MQHKSFPLFSNYQKKKNLSIKRKRGSPLVLVLLISAIALILINNRNIFDQSSILDTLFNVVAFRRALDMFLEL